MYGCSVGSVSSTQTTWDSGWLLGCVLQQKYVYSLACAFNVLIYLGLQMYIYGAHCSDMTKVVFDYRGDLWIHITWGRELATNSTLNKERWSSYRVVSQHRYHVCPYSLWTTNHSSHILLTGLGFHPWMWHWEELCEYNCGSITRILISSEASGDFSTMQVLPCKFYKGQDTILAHNAAWA